LQRFHRACQSATAQTEAQTGTMSAGMDMSQQSQTELAMVPSDSQTGMVLLTNVSCTRDLCSQASVFASSAGTDHSQFKTLAVSAILPANLVLHTNMENEAPPSRLAAISPISIHLRI
jgi:hypothetical protein